MFNPKGILLGLKVSRWCLFYAAVYHYFEKVFGVGPCWFRVVKIAWSGKNIRHSTVQYSTMHHIMGAGAARPRSCAVIHLIVYIMRGARGWELYWLVH